MYKSKQKKEKEFTISVGIRISVIILIPIISALVFVYSTLSASFKDTLVDYSLSLLQSMATQGVNIVEKELESNLMEVEVMAKSLNIGKDFEIQSDVFSKYQSNTEYLEILIFDANGNIKSSNKKFENIKNRQDFINVMKGEASVFGPYFDSDNKFVIDYSAPIYDGNKILGMLLIQKDGYQLSQLLKESGFGLLETGEAYIINEDGTDIAVSNLEHIDWVTDKYNSQELLKEDISVKDIADLEKKGMSGETGVGQYNWDAGTDNPICHLAYKPFKTQSWTFLMGARDEEMKGIADKTISKLTFTLIFSLIVILFFIILVTLVISIKFKNLKKYVENLSIGDFTKELKVPLMHDEFRVIYIALNNTKDSLKNLVSEAKNNSAILSKDWDNLNNITKEFLSLTSGISMAMNEIANANNGQSEDISSMRDIFDIFRNNLEDILFNIDVISKHMHNIHNDTTMSSKEMENTSTIIDEFKVKFDNFIGIINETNRQIDNISQFTNIINDISEKTDLLALNASIEAAKAEENGKGFSVLAAEIRSLAQQSKDAAVQINEITEKANENSKVMIDSSNNMQLKVQLQQQSIHQVISNFNNIVMSVNDVQPTVNSLSNFVSKISNQKDEISVEIESITTVSQQISASTEEVVASAENLSNSSQEVESIIGKSDEVIINLENNLNKFKIV